MGDEVTVVGGIENTETPTGEQVVTSGEQTTTTINVGEGGDQPSEQPEQEATGDVQSAYNKSQEAQAALRENLDTKGVDFDACVKEYTDKGSLSTDTYDKLSKAGYPKQVVDAFINGTVVANQQMANEVMTAVGGQENFQKLADYAKGLGPSMIESWNRTVDTGDINMITMMLKGVQADYTEKYGTSNPTIMGSKGGSQPVTGFVSTAEMVKAMSDPKYGKDQAYTHEVEAKVKQSNIFR